MSNNQIEVPSTGRAGQSTQIEQARAMAQVHAMMRMAQEFPRDPRLAWTRMEDACSQMELAERAFFRFPRGDGQQVSGASVHLARELARCWGNIDFGVSELSRDDYKGESEMLAQAWDIEACIRSYATFIVPHKRDKGNKSVALLTMRDIYENNANAGARRLREAIFAVLPLRFCLEAQRLCTETLEDKNNEQPFHERVEVLVNWYANHGVKSNQLTDKIGKPIGHWAAGDLALLRVIMHSLHAKETTIELEFPTVFTRAEDIAGPAGPEVQAAVKGGQSVGPVETTQWADVPAQPTGPVVDADYVCDVCQSVGQHLQDVCPDLADDGT